MRNQVRIAFAALAIGGVALPPTSVAQTREAADAAEAFAQPDAGAEAFDAPSKPAGESGATEALAKPDAGRDSVDAATQAAPEADAAEPTWDAVIRVVEEALTPELMAENREAADAAAALGSAGGDADAAGPLARADVEDFVTAPATEAAIQVTNWVIASGDNGGLPFIVISNIRRVVAPG